LNYIIFMIFQHNNTQFWPWFEHYVKYHQVCLLVEPYALLIPQPISVCNKLNFLFNT
jgi:hypothetical protein